MLHAHVPVHYVGVTQTGVPVADAAAAVVGAYEWRNPIDDARRGRSGRLADLVNRRRVARIGLLERNALILVVLVAVRRELRIYGEEAKTAAEHPLLERMPGKPEPRIEVVAVPAIQPVGGMCDRADAPGKRVRPGRVELAHQSVLRGEGTLIGIAQADVCRQSPSDLPVILNIEAVDGGARQPARQLAGGGRRGDVAGQEAGKGAAGIANCGPIGVQSGSGAREAVPHRIRQDRRVEAEPEQLIPELEACVPRMCEASSRNEIVSFTVRLGAAPLSP